MHSRKSWRRVASDRETLGYLLGGMYARQKKYDQAEQVFKGVLAINPQNAPALNYYGYMLAEQGVRLDEAVNMLKRALGPRSRQRRVSRQHGLVLLQAEQD